VTIQNVLIDKPEEIQCESTLLYFDSNKLQNWRM